MLRRWAGPGITLILGIALELGGWSSRATAILLLGIATAWTVLAIPPVSRRFPRVQLERGDGVAVRIRRPEAQGKRRLRSDTLAFVAELHAYLRDQPSSMYAAVREHNDMTAEMNHAASKEDRERIWHETTARMAERTDLERRELLERFGGRLQYLLGEYRRWGLISDSYATRIEWSIGSVHWASDTVAPSLEALARRL